MVGLRGFIISVIVREESFFITIIIAVTPFYAAELLSGVDCKRFLPTPLSNHRPAAKTSFPAQMVDSTHRVSVSSMLRADSRQPSNTGAYYAPLSDSSLSFLSPEHSVSCSGSAAVIACLSISLDTRTNSL